MIGGKEMKNILIDQCLQCWHLDDDTYRCRDMGEKIMNPYVIPADCPLEDEPEQKPDLPESKGSETDMGTKIEPEFPSWTETESGVTEKSNPQYGIYHFLKHWYYRVVAPCLKSDGWIPVSERLPKPIMRNGYFGFKFLFYTEDQRRVSYYENFMWGNIEVANESLKIFLAKSKIANWQPLPPAPQEKGETK
jgi:hypothetical protein